MSATLLIGTAVTRKGAQGTLYRSVNGTDWKPASGISLETGVQAFTGHPREPGVVFAATRGGMFKSVDHGESWRKLDVPSAQEEFWSVTVDPHDPDVVFAGVAPVGVYRSDDGGEQWRRVGRKQGMPELCTLSAAKGFSQSRLMRIFCHPSNPDLLFGAAETNGVILSEDAGETWHDASRALITLAEQHENLKSAIIAPETFEGMLDGHAVLVSPKKPDVLFYACRMGVFSSADKGKSWRNHHVEQFAPFTYSRDLRLAADDPATFYLALSIASRSNSGALYRSRDIGETWERVDQPVTNRSTIMSMNVHASDADKVIYITRGGQVIWTEDRCQSWHESQLPAEAGDGFCACIL